MRLLLRVWSPTGEVHVTDGPAVLLSDRETGETLRYLPGLVVDGDAMQDALSWLSGDTAPRSVRVTVLQAGGLQVAGYAELARIRPDATDAADREVIARGRLDELAAEAEWWAAAIVEDTADDRGDLLPPAARVSAATWPRTVAGRAADGAAAYNAVAIGRDDAAEGAPYPVPIGLPGAGVPVSAIGINAITSIPGGPALVAETNAGASFPSDRAILVGPWPIDATYVRVGGPRDAVNGGPWSARLPVELAHDIQGRSVAVVYPTSTSAMPEQDSAVWVRYVEADGGGILDPYGPGRLERADHVIRWALERSTVRVDRLAMPRLSCLAGIRLATTISSQVRPWDWLQSQVLPLLPVSVAHGPGGLYVWPWAPALDDGHASAVLEVGRNCTRLGPWLAAPLQPLSRLDLSYAQDAQTGTMRRRWSLVARPGPQDDPATTGRHYWLHRAAASLSAISWAGAPVESIEAPLIVRPDSAHRVADYAVQARCRPQTTSTLRAALSTTEARPGDLVRVIDSAMAVDAVAQVESVRYNGDDGADYTVRVWAQTEPTPGG